MKKVHITSKKSKDHSHVAVKKKRDLYSEVRCQIYPKRKAVGFLGSGSHKDREGWADGVDNL